MGDGLNRTEVMEKLTRALLDALLAPPEHVDPPIDGEAIAWEVDRLRSRTEEAEQRTIEAERRSEARAAEIAQWKRRMSVWEGKRAVVWVESSGQSDEVWHVAAALSPECPGVEVAPVMIRRHSTDPVALGVWLREHGIADPDQIGFVPPAGRMPLKYVEQQEEHDDAWRRMRDARRAYEKGVGAP